MTSSVSLSQSHQIWPNAMLIWSMVTVILFTFLTFLAVVKTRRIDF